MLETQHITTILDINGDVVGRRIRSECALSLDTGTSLCTSDKKINDLLIQQSKRAGKVFLALDSFGS
jgi:hypothetical protein